jgi:putative membrane protein
VRWGALLVGLAAAGPAAAHGGPPVANPAWTFDPFVTLPLLVSGGLYLTGTALLWARVGAGRGIRPGQVVAYAAGILGLALALTSPLHWLGEQLFTAHMVEHEIVMAVAAPLLALARPLGAFAWALPIRARRGLALLSRAGPLRSAWSLLTRPSVATALHGAAIWVWHWPPLLDGTVEDVALHRLQHLSFLVTALLFWWSLLRRADPGAAVFHLFATMIHMAVLGALIALAPRVLYPVQTAGAALCGLSPLEDQQLAGLIMWVPAGTVYAGAALAFVATWIRRSGPRGSARHALP